MSLEALSGNVRQCLPQNWWLSGLQSVSVTLHVWWGLGAKYLGQQRSDKVNKPCKVNMKNMNIINLFFVSGISIFIKLSVLTCHSVGLQKQGINFKIHKKKRNEHVNKCCRWTVIKERNSVLVEPHYSVIDWNATSHMACQLQMHDVDWNVNS